VNLRLGSIGFLRDPISRAAETRSMQFWHLFAAVEMQLSRGMNDVLIESDSLAGTALRCRPKCRLRVGWKSSRCNDRGLNREGASPPADAIQKDFAGLSRLISAGLLKRVIGFEPTIVTSLKQRHDRTDHGEHDYPPH
jgi:hypothetical protein